MKARREYSDYIRDMLEAVAKARQFTTGMSYPDFAADERTVFAAVRALEIIGEASTKVPRSMRDQHPELPWRAIAGIRNRLIHEYFGVDTEVVWRTIKEDLPGLMPPLEALLVEVEAKAKASGE